VKSIDEIALERGSEVFTEEIERMIMYDSQSIGIRTAAAAVVLMCAMSIYTRADAVLKDHR